MHEWALGAIAGGAAIAPVAEAYSDVVRAAVAGWANAYIEDNPPPRPVCVVQLGSTARGEGLPGTQSSSDVDYLLVMNGAATPQAHAWARGLHADLSRRGAEQGIELCSQLNGVEFRVSPQGWFARASNLVDAGNLCTARRIAGDEGLFAEVEAQRAAFHAEADGDPAAELRTQRPLKVQFKARLQSWLPKAHSDAKKMLAELQVGLPADPSRTWKAALQVGVVAMQNMAVQHDLRPRNTLARVDAAQALGVLDGALGARVRAALDFFATQKALDKQGLPTAAAAAARPHVQTFIDLLSTLQGDQARRRDGFERAPQHRALAPAAPAPDAQPHLRPHELRARRARE